LYMRIWFNDRNVRAELMNKKEALNQEYVRLTEELKEVNTRLDEVRPKDVASITSKELLQEYELLLTRKTQIEKRMNEITSEITQLHGRKWFRRR
jgi:predicted  nucleic acid-binding Zn-ribbon protein